jgi:glycosyltransferase involved in cell wall biosynthesis
VWARFGTDSARVSMRLKLLIYTHRWAPSVGGVETITRALAEGLAEWSETHPGQSVDVTLVTLTNGENIDDSHLPFRVFRRPSLLKLVQLFRSTDIIHLAGPALIPLLLGWLLRKPVVLEHHNYQSICPNGLLIYGPGQSICPGHFMAGRYGKCLDCNADRVGPMKSFVDLILMFPRRWLSRRVAANVAPSRHMRVRAALPRTQVIYHGVARAGRPRAVPIVDPKQPPVFAFVGRLVREKGGSVLLRAAQRLLQKGFDFRIRIIGDGPEKPELEKLATELGLQAKTEFMGSVPFANISDALEDAMAVIMPSTWEDVAPLVALELMMQGQLVIASDVGGLGETVDGFGLKFPVGDIVALETCLRQSIENTNLNRQMRNEAYSYAVGAYTKRRMIEEHFCLYEELIAPRSV